jgi:hypothetical protein
VNVHNKTETIHVKKRKKIITRKNVQTQVCRNRENAIPERARAISGFTTTRAET